MKDMTGKCGIITCVAFSVLLLPVFAPVVASAAETIYQLEVGIPFSGPWGRPAPETMYFSVRPGRYHITLEVERAPWDPVGLNGGVPIGLKAFAMEGHRKYNETRWETGLWKVTTYLYVPEDSQLYVVFSTSAPLGARGILKIVSY